jgi:hypothetical protein
MKVLIACERFGMVREAFNCLGHDAVSCDLLDSLLPGKHIKGDVRGVLNDNWELMICFPPCVHLAVSGARWFKYKRKEQEEALNFVIDLMQAPIKKIAIENPIGVISTKIRKPDQIIQPYFFGDPYQKTTCLWLKNLPVLMPTKIVNKGEFVVHGGKRFPKWYSNRELNRDKTFPGIAAAMAAQWTN